MSIRSRRHRRTEETPELDVTPFMNLMIVLVPVLLLSMVFVHTTVIELNFPSGSAASALDSATVNLEVRIEEGELIVADGRSIIRRLPATEGRHDLDGLAEVMKEMKRRLPDKRDVLILSEADTDYQTLVFVMDRVRSYVAVVGGDTVQAELFPDLSLGDIPTDGLLAAAGEIQ